MESKDVISANLEAWEEVAPRHAAHNQERLLTSFRDPNFSVLSEREVKWLTDLDIAGKDVAQICCNNGQELISIKRLGAARCVGFEGTEGFAAQARDLATAANETVAFEVGDIHDISTDYDGSFDLLVITIGVLSWMPSMPGFFTVMSRILKPGGAVFIHEQHPILEMFRPGMKDDPVEFELSYFDKEPFVDTDGLDYFGFEPYEAKPVSSFMHPMSVVIMAARENDLALERFEEFPDHISNSWYNVEAANIGAPMSYKMVLRKGQDAD